MKIVGIDPGTHTGVAVYDKATKKLSRLETFLAVQAEELVLDLFIAGDLERVYFEDSRLRTWFGGSGREKLQGAGSIKRDCSRWIEFLAHHKIPSKAIAPKDVMTKLTKQQFLKITGWVARSSQHSRDAAMLVFGR